MLPSAFCAITSICCSPESTTTGTSGWNSCPSSGCSSSSSPYSSAQGTSARPSAPSYSTPLISTVNGSESSGTSHLTVIDGTAETGYTSSPSCSTGFAAVAWQYGGADSAKPVSSSPDEPRSVPTTNATAAATAATITYAAMRCQFSFRNLSVITLPPSAVRPSIAHLQYRLRDAGSDR